jgi:hypothetical protein
MDVLCPIGNSGGVLDSDRSGRYAANCFVPIHDLGELDMRKVTAGVMTGLVLGTVHGIVADGGVSGGTVLFLSALARGSQGVINGLLAAYLTPSKTPLWRAGLVGAVIGAILGVVAGAQAQGLAQAVPWSAAIGLACGLVAGKTAR